MEGSAALNSGKEPVESSTVSVEKTSDGSGVVTYEGLGATRQKISDLTAITDKLEEIFITESSNLRDMLVLWSFILLVFIVFLVCFYLHIWNHSYPDKWSWQVGYETALKITIISLFVSGIAFCLKMIRSYFHLYEHNRHKIAVIKSLPTLIYASGDSGQYKFAYSKIIELIVQANNMGIISKENDASISTDLVKELIKKKGEE